MGKLVNVVLSDGKVVAVPEEDAARISGTSAGREESQPEAAGRQLAQERADSVSGIGNTITAGLEGAADMLSLGGYGKLYQALAPQDEAEAYRLRAQEHGVARGIGEVGALIAPTGWIGAGAKGAAEVSALGLAGRAGEAVAEVGGKWAGRAVEGAIFGAGAHVADTNVTGDPLTIEGVIEGMGIGAVLNIGAGALADRIEGATWNAKLGSAKSAIAREESVKAVEGAKVFDNPPPSWEEARQSHEAYEKSVAKSNRGIEKANREYEEFVSTPGEINRAADRAQKVVNTIRNERYAAANASGPWETTTTAEGPVNVSYGEAARKPPISPDLTQRLNNYEARISRVMKLASGGVDPEVAGAWKKVPGLAADPKRALDELRGIYRDLHSGETGFPVQASRHLKELPPVPQPLAPLSEVKLPRDFRKFAQMRPETIQRLAEHVDPATARAFDQLTKDIGLATKATPGETLASTHATLGRYDAALGKVARAAEDEAMKDAGKPWYSRVLKRALGYAAGNHIAKGLGLGLMGRMMFDRAAGELTAKALDGAMVAGKMGLRDRIRGVVAKYGLPAAGAARKLGPVTAYLQQSFPTGQRDPEKDVRKLAANRMRDVHSAAMTGPDVAYMAVTALLGHPDDVALKVHQRVVGTLQHLISTLPQDPGVQMTMFGSKYTPKMGESIAMAHRLEAAQDPLTAVARVLAGKSNPAAVETLWAAYPAVMNELAAEIALAAPDMKSLDQSGARAYSQLFRQPMSGLQNPVVINTIQGVYMQQSNAAQQMQAAMSKGGGGTGNPVGRPAAIQSPLAGTSPANLTSQ